MNVLAIYSGLFGDHSNSNALVESTLATLEERHGPLTATRRNLIETPLPYFDASVITALGTPESERTEEQAASVALSDSLINELKTADALVIGMPMYNFGVPAQFKTWVDYLSRAGVTFQYTENGPVGLIENKPVYVVAARGGQYAGTVKDSQTPFLQTALAFWGLTDVHMIYAEGLAMGDERKADGLASFQAVLAQTA